MIVEVPGLETDKYATTVNADVLDHVEAADGTPRPKRRTKVASIIKSLFKVRSIDVTKKLDAHEKMLANWVLKKDDEDGDVIIYQSSEFSAKIHVVSCLLPDSAITNELLDLWSCILNYNENFRSRGTTCFYASTSLCIELFYDGKRRKDVGYKKFAQMLDSEIKRLSIYKLNEISLFLFPVILATFSGLLCMAPESQKFTILNSASTCKDAAVEKIIMSRAELLRQSLSKYLGERSLVRRSKSVALSVPEVVCPAWTKDVDAADAGVITMRHMETFKGAFTKSCSPQIKTRDKSQMKIMRKRYRCVIACALNNGLKEPNLAAAKNYQPLHMAKKTKKTM